MAEKLKFAIVDSSRLFHELMRKNVNSGAVGNCFYDNIDFGKSDISIYDIIFLGKINSRFTNEEIAKSIRKKTNAIIVLINDENERFSQEMVSIPDLKIVRKETFFDYKTAHEFLDPIYAIIEDRRTIKTAKDFVIKINSDLNSHVA